MKYIVFLWVLGLVVGCKSTTTVSLANGKKVILNDSYGLFLSKSKINSEVRAAYYSFTQSDIKKLTGNLHEVPSSGTLKIELTFTSKANAEKYTVADWFKSNKSRLNLSLYKTTDNFIIYTERLSPNRATVTGYYLLPNRSGFGDILIKCSTNFGIKFTNKNGACTVEDFYTKEITVSYTIPFKELEEPLKYINSVNELLNKNISIQ